MLKKAIILVGVCAILYGLFVFVIVVIKPSVFVADIETGEWGNRKWEYRRYKSKVIESIMMPFGHLSALTFGNRYYLTGNYTYIGRDPGYGWYDFEKEGKIFRFNMASEFIGNVIDRYDIGDRVRLTLSNGLYLDENLRYHYYSHIALLDEKGR